MSKNNNIQKIGTITVEQQIKMERKTSRQEEINENPHKGFKSMHSVHKSSKTYNRKAKHKRCIAA